jgi:hypothetical protein
LSLIDDIVRQDAWRLLAEALAAEVRSAPPGSLTSATSRAGGPRSRWTWVPLPCSRPPQGAARGLQNSRRNDRHLGHTNPHGYERAVPEIQA